MPTPAKAVCAFSSSLGCLPSWSNLCESASAARSRFAGSTNQVQRPLPPRIAHKVQHYVPHPRQAVANSCLLILVFRCLERPVIKQRPVYDVLSWHKTPVARIQAVVPVVAHHEIVPRRNYQVAIHDVTW